MSADSTSTAPESTMVAISVRRRPYRSLSVPQTAAPSRKPKKKAEFANWFSGARSQMSGGDRSLPMLSCGLSLIHI